MPKSLFTFHALFSAARMATGATTVVYMISKGIHLEDIAFIKFVQGLIIFFGEIPTGLVADTYGRKNSMLWSCAMALISFGLYFYGTNIVWFSAAEIFNALTIAFWSGAFEALFVDHHHQSKDKKSLNYYFHRLSTFGALATMAGGFFGGYLGEWDLSYSFILSFGLMALSFFGIMVFVKDLKDDEPEATGFNEDKNRFKVLWYKIKQNTVMSFEWGFKNKKLKPYFILMILLQFMLQPVFHYWQPYFQSFGVGVTSKVLGTIFFLYVGGHLVFSFVASMIQERGLFSEGQLLACTLFLNLAAFIILCIRPSYGLSLMAFIIMQGGVTVLRNILSVKANEFIPSKVRATVLSSVSFVSRIGMLGALVTLGGSFKFLAVEQTYYLSTMCMLVVIPWALKWYLHEMPMLSKKKAKA